MIQKRLSYIVIIFGAIMLAGVAGYIIHRRTLTKRTAEVSNFAECVRAGYWVGESNPRQCLIPGGRHFVEDVRTTSPITISGKTTCLAKKGAVQQTLECLVGLEGTDGRYYILRGYLDPEYKFTDAGLGVKVSGIFTPGDAPSSDGNTYDVAGTIEVSSIQLIEGNTRPVPGTGYPKNNDSGNSSPAGQADNSLPSAPSCEVAVPKPQTACANGAHWDFIPTDSSCHGSWKCIIAL